MCSEPPEGPIDLDGEYERLKKNSPSRVRDVSAEEKASAKAAGVPWPPTTPAPARGLWLENSVSPEEKSRSPLPPHAGPGAPPPGDASSHSEIASPSSSSPVPRLRSVLPVGSPNRMKPAGVRKSRRARRRERRASAASKSSDETPTPAPVEQTASCYSRMNGKLGACYRSCCGCRGEDRPPVGRTASCYSRSKRKLSTCYRTSCGCRTEDHSCCCHLHGTFCRWFRRYQSVIWAAITIILCAATVIFLMAMYLEASDDEYNRWGLRQRSRPYKYWLIRAKAFKEHRSQVMANEVANEWAREEAAKVKLAEAERMAEMGIAEETGWFSKFGL